VPQKSCVPGSSSHRSRQGHIGLRSQRSAPRYYAACPHGSSTITPARLHTLWGMHCLGGKIGPAGLTRDSRVRCRNMPAGSNEAAQSQPGGRCSRPVSPAPQHAAAGRSSLNPHPPKAGPSPKSPLCESSALAEPRSGHGRHLTMQKRQKRLRRPETTSVAPRHRPRSRGHIVVGNLSSLFEGSCWPAGIRSLQWASLGPSRGQPSREEHVGCFQALGPLMLQATVGLLSSCSKWMCGGVHAPQRLKPNAARRQGVMASTRGLRCLTLSSMHSAQRSGAGPPPFEPDSHLR